MTLKHFIERPVLASVISIVIVIAGIIGLATLPIEQYPDIAPPTVMVRASYPGASAETIQKSVIVPLEQAINGVENMTYITSSAAVGSASVTVYFRQGTDPDMAAVNVQNKVSRATGQLPSAVTQIGVSTMKRQTSMVKIFSLYSPDDSYDETFLSKLTLPGAMPCDEAFFDSTRGTYGLTSASTLSSGHFYLYNWTSSGLFLRRAASGSQIDSLRLVENTTSSGQSAEELINNEKCTAALDDSGTPTSLQSVSYSDTTWALLFNCDSIFASTELRQALGSAAASAVEVPGGGLFAEAKGLIPDGLTVDGIDYRQTAGDVRPAFGDPRALYIAARDGGVSPSDFGRVSLLLPSGSGLSDTAELINSAWQKEFSLFFSVEEVEPEEFQKRLENGSYTIALAPVQAEGGSVYTALAQFSPTGGGLTGYSDALYTTQLSASATATGSTRCSLLAACERQLLEQAVAVPLFTQQKRLLVANGIEGLVFDPFGPVLDVTYATKS